MLVSAAAATSTRAPTIGTPPAFRDKRLKGGAGNRSSHFFDSQGRSLEGIRFLMHKLRQTVIFCAIATATLAGQTGPVASHAPTVSSAAPGGSPDLRATVARVN